MQFLPKLHRMAKTPLLDRVRAEFSEQPGLRLTCRQATRLWGVDTLLCASLLDLLVEDGYLESRDGYYMKRSVK